MHDKRRIHTHDRRQRPTPAISRHLFRGRRRGPRRHSDAGSNYYTDIPSVGALLTVGMLLTLSLLDAILSLRLFALEKSEEVNPLLSLMLDHSDVAFIAVKLALTAASLLVLLLHWNFVVRGRISTVHAVYWLIGTYMSVVIYETGLLWW